MSFIDIFAWIVLFVLIAIVVAIFVALGMMPGRIARKRGHPWARGGVDRRLGDADLRLRVLAAGADLGLCRCAGEAGDRAMIVVLLNGYIAILALFVWLRFIPFNTFWKISPVIVLLLLLVGLFIPMGWGAPSGPVAVVRNSVQIVPSVAGEVIEVPVTANTPLKEGDVLFRIDPTTYRRRSRRSRRSSSSPNCGSSRYSELQSARHRPGLRRAAARSRGQTAARRSSTARKWNLDKTTVRAPADGYVTNLALRKGARVTAQSPVMAFIDTSETIFGGGDSRRSTRAISRSGSRSRSRSRPFPGEVYTGRVEAVLQAIATGQTQTGGLAVAPTEVAAAPFVVRFKLDDREVARAPAGRQHRPRGDLHRSRQGGHVIRAGRAAADRDPELRQSV